MGYYEDVYLARLNRYGNNYQERKLTQRREVFERRLLKSVYRIDFDYNGETHSATFERNSQDNTQTMHYLLTRYDDFIPNGTVLFLPDPFGYGADGTAPFPEIAGPRPNVSELGEELRPWMVFYLEDSGAKGYNRYIMLRMTHYLKWKDREGIDRTTYAYMYGQEDNMLKDELRSRSRMDILYTENLKMSFFIIPSNEHLRKDDYFIIDKTINNKVLEEYFRVTGYDIQSQDGVEYVTVDPVYEYSKDFYDKLEHPVIKPEQWETEEERKNREKEQEKIDDNFFWLTGQTTDVEAE